MMMVLITYDVSTEDNAGKTRLRKVQRNVSIMDSEYKILYLNVYWMRLRHCC